MKKGDIVTIYDDPWSERYPEGEARLVRKIRKGDRNPEYWEVVFLNVKDKKRVNRSIRRHEQ